MQNVLHGSTIPAPLAADPAGIKPKIEQWRRQRAEAARKAALRLEALQRAEATRASASRGGQAEFPLCIDAVPGLQADLVLVLREMEALLEEGIRGLPGSWTWELWPLRDDLNAVRAIWAAAVRASDGRLPGMAAVGRARQSFEQETRDQ